jgi:hypothetical protein
MYLLQSLIVFAVVASNIHWQWTPNGYVASTMGIGLAYAVTFIACELRTWPARERARREKQVSHRIGTLGWWRQIRWVSDRNSRRPWRAAGVARDAGDRHRP